MSVLLHGTPMLSRFGNMCADLNGGSRIKVGKRRVPRRRRWTQESREQCDTACGREPSFTLKSCRPPGLSSPKGLSSVEKSCTELPLRTECSSTCMTQVPRCLQRDHAKSLVLASKSARKRMCNGLKLWPLMVSEHSSGTIMSEGGVQRNKP